MDTYIDNSALLQVLVASILGGAGLVAARRAVPDGPAHDVTGEVVAARPEA
jgi:hypothetical protein